jgi:hypothetical protein
MRIFRIALFSLVHLGEGQHKPGRNCSVHALNASWRRTSPRWNLPLYARPSRACDSRFEGAPARRWQTALTGQ